MVNGQLILIGHQSHDSVGGKQNAHTDNHTARWFPYNSVYSFLYMSNINIIKDNNIRILACLVLDNIDLIDIVKRNIAQDY